MAENKIQASTVMIITILLVAGLFIAVNINNDSASVVNQPATSPKTNAGDDEAAVLVPEGLVINELMADNDKAVQSIYGGYPDWVELFNSGNYSIDLSGMYLTDDLSKLNWRFPNGTVIEPNSYLLVWADADIGRSSLQVNFNLLANGGVLGLFASDGKTVIDLVLYDKQIRDVSYGRTTDGGSSWDYMSISTAGKANVENVRTNAAAPWQIWLFIILAIAICIVVVLKDKIHIRRKT
ncbi:lamin tail domain-containing protein [Candidatus Bathyarchaeota archaeon]|nr:lamin tail domain-containing protein [Candidatus Bathyarchaeota archaeon]